MVIMLFSPIVGRLALTRRKISTIIEDLIENTRGHERLEVDDMVNCVGKRSLGPLLLLPGLLMVTPVIAGIPGLPTTMAMIVLLVASQFLMGESEIWLPDRLARRSIDREKALPKLEKLVKWAEKAEVVFRPRLNFLEGKMSQRLAGLASIVVAVLTPPLEFVPLLAMIPGFIILLYGIGITTRDGLVMLMGHTILIGSASYGTYYLLAA